MMAYDAMKNNRLSFEREALKSKLRGLKDSINTIGGIIEKYESLIEAVFQKIKSVQGIANKTNLLAINASIETIHASELLNSFESIVTKNLMIQAKILAQILEHDPDFFYQDGGKFARECSIEEFYITNAQGIVEFTNMTSWKNTQLKTGEILRILKNPELEIEMPAVSNNLGTEQYKVVGVSRIDQTGVIQIGAHYTKPKGQLAIDGFGVVAQEAKRLADVSKEISVKITNLTNDLGTNLNELSKSLESTYQSVAVCVGEEERVQADLSLEDIERQEQALNGCKDNVQQLESRLIEARQYFREILSPLTELINIARQTNLLGVRAAIEAAHSTNDKMDFDNLLNKHMTTEAKLVALLIERWTGLTCDLMEDFATRCKIDEIWAVDEHATVDLTNIKGGKGFVFQNEGQTAPFMRLLSDPEGVVTAPPALRALDNRIFKYVGVGRREKSGFIQVGYVSKLYGESTAEGFSVVAKQIKNLAEQSRITTTEIQQMLEDMNLGVHKAIENMVRVKKYQADIKNELQKIKLMEL